MKILVLSDSHGKEQYMISAIRREKPFDVMLHLGDSQSTLSHMQQLAGCPVYMVAGNCDLFTDLPEEQIVQLEGHRLLLTHGHYHYVSTVGTKYLKEEAFARDCDIALFGHTHRPCRDEADQRVIVLNPGSISLPRQEGKRPSYFVMKLRAGEAPEIRFDFF